MFIAFDEAKAVGFSHVYIRNEWCWTENESGPFGYIDTIYVCPDYRKKGIAQNLVKICEDWAREKGCVEFAGDCDLDNTASLAFHKNIGFEETHRIIHFSKEL
jgi:aminoglycoside 6'-N-acetyltransferase I